MTSYIITSDQETYLLINSNKIVTYSNYLNYQRVYEIIDLKRILGIAFRSSNFHMNFLSEANFSLGCSIYVFSS